MPKAESNLMGVEKPQYQQIADLLEKTRRNLKKPTKLLPEVVLAEKYSVARETIRRTLAVLERNGAVTRHRGRGTFLRPLHNQMPVSPGTSVGFVPPWWATSLNAWYTATVFDGVSHWSEHRELQQSILRVDRFENDPHALLEKVRARQMRGLIWVHPVIEQLDLLATVARHIPCVVVGRLYADAHLHTVLPDYEQAAMLIDRHLAENGHEVYGVLSRILTDPLAATWLDGFTKAHAARGARFDAGQNYVDVGCYDRNLLSELMSRFYLPHHPDVKALVATSSSYLVPLLSDESFRKRVPEDISLIAFDYGVQPMNTYWPGLTISHVACDWAAIGQKAMETLCALIDGQDAPRVQYQPVSLVEGQTVRDQSDASSNGVHHHMGATS